MITYIALLNLTDAGIKAAGGIPRAGSTQRRLCRDLRGAGRRRHGPLQPATRRARLRAHKDAEGVPGDRVPRNRPFAGLSAGGSDRRSTLRGRREPDRIGQKAEPLRTASSFPLAGRRASRREVVPQAPSQNHGLGRDGRLRSEDGKPARADADDVELTTSIMRSGAFVLFALSAYSAMIVLGVCAIIVAVLTFIEAHPPETSLIGSLAAIAFALPVLCNTLPGSPPLGVQADMWAFLWAELVTVLALALGVQMDPSGIAHLARRTGLLQERLWRGWAGLGGGAYSAASRIAARMLARKSSIGVKPAGPLDMPERPAVAGRQAPAPARRSCGSSRPRGRRRARRPPAPRALWRPPASTSRSPGRASPASTTLAKATRGSLRRVGAAATASSGKGSTASIRLPRGRGIARIALDADERAAEAPGGGPGGAGAEERIEHQIAGVGGGQQHPRQQRLGLLGRMGLAPASRPSAAPAPVQIGRNQSERTWQSSLPAFSAS